ncbi:hypothetical protein SprV_0802559300 [Sparganum proliferum]
MDPISLLKTAEGELLTEDGAKVNHFSEFFRSAFISETEINSSAFQPFEDTTLMETIQFTKGMVLTELMRLKKSKSPGPDEISAKRLKELAAVHVSDQQSAEVAVRSGVLQGSVLGPTLFLVCVNDCANELDCDVARFADDIKTWGTIRSDVDEARVQTNLDHLEQSSKDWLLPFNVNKCNFLRVDGTSSPSHAVYRLTGKPLQVVDAEKDLGIWITTSLKPSLQCSNIAKSEMSIIYFVKRAFSSFDEDCFATVLQTFVRPHLEFAIQAWRPWNAKDLGTLENVQRRATNFESGQWTTLRNTNS